MQNRSKCASLSQNIHNMVRGTDDIFYWFKIMGHCYIQVYAIDRAFININLDVMCSVNYIG